MPLYQWRLDEIIKNSFSHRGFKPLLDRKFTWWFVSTSANLARDFKDTEVVDAWLSSMEHHEIIENKTYTYGCVEKRNNFYVFVTGERMRKVE